MDVTKPYKFIGLGVMDVTKPYEFIWLGAMEVTKPYVGVGRAGRGTHLQPCKHFIKPFRDVLAALILGIAL